MRFNFNAFKKLVVFGGLAWRVFVFGVLLGVFLWVQIKTALKGV